MAIDSNTLDGAARAIGDASVIAMVCHIGPDGDAIGSMLGMAVAAAAAGKRVVASFGEPFTVPDAFRYLPTDRLVPPADMPPDPEVLVTFDAGSPDRLGELQALVDGAGAVVVIDHHVSNTGFGTHDLIDPEASATAEIVVALLDRLGWRLTAEVATCLHTGIVTDTGRFQYSNTRPGTLQVAARLVEAGARPEVIGRHVYEEVPFGYLEVAGAVLSRARLDPERRLVWSVVTQEDLDEAGISLDDTDPLIDALRVARESDVAMLLKHLGPSRVKGSLRSRGRVDVGAIAVALGGGGHHNAAGFTFDGTPEETLAAVIALLDQTGD
jgi:phosphoesterase RecJ-like protein